MTINYSQHGGPLSWETPPVPVYLSRDTFVDVSTRFPYLVPGDANPLEREMKEAREKGGGDIKRGRGRTVSRLDYRILEEGPGGQHAPYKTFEVRLLMACRW